MSMLIYSSSLLAAFLGGVLALFAPCCIVSLLPAYIGSAVGRQKLGLPATTGLFALGIAVVMLPIVLGVGLIGVWLGNYHSLVSLVVGLFLLGLGVLILSGKTMELPIPTLNIRVKGRGPGAIFLLGVSSGLASACCAPVFAGVVAISMLGGSIGGSLALAGAYIFGMVFPLLVIALVWEIGKLEDKWRGTFKMRKINVLGRTLGWTDLAAGSIFSLMGLLAIGLAASGQSTLTPPWLGTWNIWTRDLAGSLTMMVNDVPGWVQLGVLLAVALVVTASFFMTRKRGEIKPADNKA